MQKLMICALALLATAAAFPQEQPEPVHILRQESDVSPDGYHFAFETSDGTSRQEQGTLKDIGEGLRAIEVSGSYQYKSPDGTVHSVTFTADENGFKPQEHIGQVGDSQQQYQQQDEQQYQQYQQQ